jgi:hypothetical protein
LNDSVDPLDSTGDVVRLEFTGAGMRLQHNFAGDQVGWGILATFL